MCDVNNFREILLTSTVSKALCMVLNNCLSIVADEEGLIVDAQGGFMKQRGCRDQVLSLVLFGQMEMIKKSSGMLVAFIDFSKAYVYMTRWTGECRVLWRGWGLTASFCIFFSPV